MTKTTELLDVITLSDTSANWATSTKIILSGQEAIASDTREKKYGEGKTWNNTPLSKAQTDAAAALEASKTNTETIENIDKGVEEAIAGANVVITGSKKNPVFNLFAGDNDNSFLEYFSKSLFDNLLSVEERGFNSNTGDLVAGNSTFLGAWSTQIGVLELVSDTPFSLYANVGCWSGEPSSDTYLGVVNVVENRFETIPGTTQICVSVLGSEDYGKISLRNVNNRVFKLSEKHLLEEKGVLPIQPIEKGFISTTGSTVNNNTTYKGVWFDAEGSVDYVLVSKGVWYAHGGVGCYSGEPSPDTYLGLINIRSEGDYTFFKTLERTTQVVVGIIGTHTVGTTFKLFKANDYSVKFADSFKHTEKEINILKNRIFDLENRNPFMWGAFNNGKISFVIDDANNDVGTLSDEFISKNIPVCLAIPPQRIRATISNSVSGGDDALVLDVAKTVVSNGGEILSHSYTVINSANTYNADVLYATFAESKRVLIENGFEINGIILAGGSGYDSADFEILAKWASEYYSYSDLYGLGTNYQQHYNTRSSLSGKTLQNLKDEVDDAISNNTWVSFFTHGAADSLDLTILTDLLDYINTKKTADELDTVTYKSLYDGYKSSVLEQRMIALEQS